MIRFYITKQTGSLKIFRFSFLHSCVAHKILILTVLLHVFHSAEEIPVVPVEFHSRITPAPSPALWLPSHIARQALLCQINTDDFCWLSEGGDQGADAWVQVGKGREEDVCRAGHWHFNSQEWHSGCGEWVCCGEWSSQGAGFSSQLGKRTKPPPPQTWTNTK